MIKEKYSEQGIAYLILRNFVSTIINESINDFEESELIKNEVGIQADSIRNRIKEGRNFKPGEVKKIANYAIKKIKSYIQNHGLENTNKKIDIFQKILKYFFEINNIQEKEIDEILSDDFFKNPEVVYCNLTGLGENYIPLEEIREQLYSCIQDNKFIFFSGEHCSGKNSLAKDVARYYLFDDNSGYNHAFHIKCNPNMSYVNFLKEIAYRFNNRENYDNYSIDDFKKIIKYYLYNNKSILFIEGFNYIENTDDQEKIIDFLTEIKDFIENIDDQEIKKDNAKETIVIVTSTKTKNDYDFLKNNQKFTSVEMRAFTDEELREYFHTFKNQTGIYSSKLYEKVIKRANGNPIKAKDLLFEEAGKEK